MNENNFMALDESRIEYERVDDMNVIWEPIIHDLFNENGKIIHSVNCGMDKRFIVFIDNKNQLYFSPPFGDEKQME